MDLGLEGRVALVTGGGRGIGAATAEALAAAGAVVCVTSRTGVELAAVCGRIESAGGRAAKVVADVTREADVARLFDETARALGVPTLVVNCAGHATVGPTADVEVDEFERHLSVNLTASFLVCREAFRRMPELGGGRIVNVSSGAGKHGHAEWAAYCAAKSGLQGLSRALAVEGVPLGIRVNTVCPGGTKTGMRHAIFGDEPDGSLLEPAEVAEVIVFLLSDAAAEVRGAELDVRKAKPT